MGRAREAGAWFLQTLGLRRSKNDRSWLSGTRLSHDNADIHIVGTAEAM
jgi:hypothetical protein